MQYHKTTLLTTHVTMRLSTTGRRIGAAASSDLWPDMYVGGTHLRCQCRWSAAVLPKPCGAASPSRVTSLTGSWGAGTGGCLPQGSGYKQSATPHVNGGSARARSVRTS